jgi:ribosomal 50S subunit-recycling heat shock protein
MYLVLSDCVASGKRLKSGDIVELDQETADTLVRIGRVEKTSAKKEEKPVEQVKKTTRQAKAKTKREK